METTPDNAPKEEFTFLCARTPNLQVRLENAGEIQFDNRIFRTFDVDVRDELIAVIEEGKKHQRPIGYMIQYLDKAAARVALEEKLAAEKLKLQLAPSAVKGAMGSDAGNPESVRALAAMERMSEEDRAVLSGSLSSAGAAGHDIDASQPAVGIMPETVNTNPLAGNSES